MKSNRQSYSVEKMCKVFTVSKNAYYNWMRNRNKEENVFKRELKSKIRFIFEESRKTYGSPRIQAELKKSHNITLSRSYISRFMKEMGLRSVLSKKFVVTTDSKHKYPICPNILEREFKVEELGKVWVSDITYIRCSQDWKYLTTIIDLADRKVVGWSLSADMSTENTFLKSWKMAKNNRPINDGFIFHSDRGVQYACGKTQGIFGYNIKAKQSMSRRGDCWDNAVAESFFKTIKYEMIYRKKYTDFNVLHTDIQSYIHWYNYKRLHSTLGYKSPFEKEMELLTKNTKISA